MARTGTVALLLPGAFYRLRETKLAPVRAWRADDPPRPWRDARARPRSKGDAHAPEEIRGLWLGADRLRAHRPQPVPHQ